MTDLTTITARDILRDYKNIFDSIKKTKRPTVVMSHKEPQVAIISLDDLDTLQKLKSKNSAKSLLDFASNARTLLAKEKLPHDLAANHNNYLWGN